MRRGTLGALGQAQFFREFLQQLAQQPGFKDQMYKLGRAAGKVILTQTGHIITTPTSETTKQLLATVGPLIDGIRDELKGFLTPAIVGLSALGLLTHGAAFFFGFSFGKSRGQK